MKICVRLLLAAALAAATLCAQHDQLLLREEDSVRISDHVWAIMGNPNIAIVVGDHATLVVDTSFGPRNGATITRVAAKLAPENRKLFLTTTHFHPDHASGVAGFPQGTILIRNRVQQEDVEKHGKEWIDEFAARSAEWKQVLDGATLRTPDVVFEDEAKIDLGGGVTVRLLWFGGGHTPGDELVFVEPDRTLVSGDLVQNKSVPAIFKDGGTPSGWVAALDKAVTLNALHVLPDHSAPGDGSLVTREKQFVGDLRNSALDLKRKGVSAEDAGKQLAGEFRQKFPDYPSMNVTGFVRSVFAEK